LQLVKEEKLTVLGPSIKMSSTVQLQTVNMPISQNGDRAQE